MSTFFRLLWSVLHDLRVNSRGLVLTDITYKLLTFMLLAPAVSIVFHVLVQRTGRTVLADEDILQFVREPLGWACIVVTLALTFALIALEQAALMAILCAGEHGRRLSVTGALRLAGARAWPILRVAARIVVLAVLALSPCLVAAGFVYWALLTEYDINYYLTGKPPAFWIAAVCGAVLGLGMVAIVLRLATSWFYALPLVCFEAIPARAALRESRNRVAGHRHTPGLWIVVWLVVTLLLSSLATTGVVLAAEWLVPRATGSLLPLLFAVGATLVIWSGLHVAINVLMTTSFAAVFFRLYRSLAARQDVDTEWLVGSAEQPGGPVFLLTRRRLVVTVAAGTAVAMAVGAYTIRSVGTVDRCAIIAHRGASGSAPENTMAAVRQAIEEQTDWVEIDVQESADGEVVVFHDRDFMKLARRKLQIWNATTADLRDIDIGSWFHPDYRAQRVPTLADVLACCRGKARVVIELKYYGHDERLESRVVECVEAQGMQSEIVTMSLRQGGVARMKQLRPDWQSGLLSAVAASDLTRADADFLAVKATLATRAFIRAAHARKKKVYAWTVNDPVTMSTLIGRGVDGIITDHPALARKVLVERAELGSVERLLITLAGRLGTPPQIVEQ